MNIDKTVKAILDINCDEETPYQIAIEQIYKNDERLNIIEVDKDRDNKKNKVKIANENTNIRSLEKENARLRGIIRGLSIGIKYLN